MNPSSSDTSSPNPRRLWVLWVLFFFQYAAIGVYFTFVNVYYHQAGLSGTQIGWLNMATSLVGVAGAIVWGYLSDRTGQARLLIAAGACAALLVAQVVPFVDTFWAFLGLGMLGSLAGSATSVLTDSTALVLLGDHKDDYGRYRLGGTFGYIFTILSAGILFDRVGLRMMFPVYGVVMALFAVAALLLPPVVIPVKSGPRGDLGRMIRQPTWWIFSVSIFLFWTASNATIMFMGISLQSMGASQGLIGLAVVISAVAEIPFMTSSGALLRRFGPIRLLLIAMALGVIRYTLLGQMHVPEWAVAINTLNGPAYVLFWVSGINLANRMAPAGMAGTAQGLFNATISLAGVLSALLTGRLFDLIGPSKMFLAFAGIALAGLVLFGLGQIRKSSRLTT